MSARSELTPARVEGRVSAFKSSSRSLGRYVRSLAFGACATLLVSCQSAVPISEITAQGNALNGRRVTVLGSVGLKIPVPLTDVTVYEIRDETGVLFVLTHGVAPQPGQHLRVTGIVQVTSIANVLTTGPVLIEETRR